MQISPAPANGNSDQPIEKQGSSRVFRMGAACGDRTAGSMPVWAAPATPEEKITGQLALASEKPNPALPSFAAALAEAGPKSAKADDSDSFGFADLIDIVNPLQHLPLIGSLYREITGDEIKPVARIVGGAAFGGVAGAASGIVNSIVEEETGKDIGGNVADALGSSEDHGTTLALANLRATAVPRYNS